MKGILITQVIYESTMDFIHGWGKTLIRLVVPEEQNLAIYSHENKLGAFLDFNLGEDSVTVIRQDVDVPQDLIDVAKALIEAQEKTSTPRSANAM